MSCILLCAFDLLIESLLTGVINSNRVKLTRVSNGSIRNLVDLDSRKIHSIEEPEEGIQVDLSSGKVVGSRTRNNSTMTWISIWRKLEVHSMLNLMCIWLRSPHENLIMTVNKHFNTSFLISVDDHSLFSQH